jgi:hypothetical protein
MSDLQALEKKLTLAKAEMDRMWTLMESPMMVAVVDRIAADPLEHEGDDISMLAHIIRREVALRMASKDLEAAYASGESE